MDGVSHHALRARLASHCLLLEMDNALVLVDTGYGLRDVRAPRSRIARTFLTMLKPELREELTAFRQIEQLGLDPRDVRHIVLSHLDFDHAGGLDDFPQATVHMMADEALSAARQATVLDRMRYRPQQWGTRANWQMHAAGNGEPWYGFASVRELSGLGPDVLMVPLLGHTHGHAGVAVRAQNEWLLYAADAYFYHAEMDVMHPRCTPGLAAYQTMMEKDRGQRLLSQARLRTLKRQHGAEVSIFCAHDLHELQRFQARSAQMSAAPSGPLAAPSAPQMGLR